MTMRCGSAARRALAAAAVALVGMAAEAGAQQSVSERLRVSPTGEVSITTVGGEVRVVGWERDEVLVTGTIGDGADRLLLEQEGGRAVVRVVSSRGIRRSVDSDLEIRVPQGRSVEVRTVRADVEVSGVRGDVDVSAGSGDVHVRGDPQWVRVVSRSGNVDVVVRSDRIAAESVSGNVTVGGTARREAEARAVSGDVTLTASAPRAVAESVSGNARVRGAEGRVEASTVSGSVRVEGRRLSGSFRSVSGDVRLAGDLDAGESTAITTHSGDVELRLSRPSATVEFTTFSGELNNAVSGATMTRSSRRAQEIRLGGGAARVSVQTFSGNVRLAGQ